MFFYQNKKNFIFLLLIILLAVIFGGMFLLYKNNSKLTDEPNQLLKNNFQEKLVEINDDERRHTIVEDVILPKHYILLGDDCDKIIDKKLKEECHYYLKYESYIKTANLSLCYSLENEWQDMCIFDIIENRKFSKNNQEEWNDCSLIKDSEIKNMCLEHQAINIKDIDICKSRDSGVSECMDRVIAVNTEWGDDITKCKEIKTSEYFERCVGISGQECSLLGEKKLIDLCESWRYFNNIIIQGEKNDCKILPIENFKITCEVYFNNNKNFIDSDGDKILDHIELSLGTNPFNGNDGEEALHHIEEEAGDIDIIINQKKFTIINSLRSLIIDSDADGLRDYEEVEIYKTDPLNPDSDRDGYADGEEVRGGFNPNK